MKLRALETTGLALALAVGLGACNVSDDPMVKSRIKTDDSVAERIRAAANGETAAMTASTMAAAAPAPAAGAAPPPPPTPSAAAPAAGAPAAGVPVQVASAEPAAAAASGYSPAAGKAHYAIYCGSCHGAAGAGDGPAAGAMNPKPAKHTDGAYMNGLSNDHLYKVVDKGGMAVGKSPMMTPWGSVLSEKQIWEVVAFMRTLATPSYDGPMP